MIRKRLLQINAVVGYGSTGRLVDSIGSAAIDAGWSSHVGYGRHKRQADSQTHKIGDVVSILSHVAMTRVLDRHGLGSKRATKDFLKTVTALAPDIIHLHNIHGYFLHFPTLFEYLHGSGRRVVWTMHDCWPFTGHCTHYDFVGCSKWLTQCRQCPQTACYPASYIIDNSRRNFELKRRVFTSLKSMEIVCVSDWMRSQVERSFLGRYPSRTIRNGVDTFAFRPIESDCWRRKLDLLGRFLILGVASKWTDRKGLNDFIRLADKLGENDRIVLVGVSPKQASGLPSCIIPIERTDSLYDLSALYSTADVYLNLSAEESFGMTTIEAMACGTPIVTYDSTASPELISTGTGYVVKRGDLSALIDAITRIKTAARGELADACRRTATSSFDIRVCCDTYIALFESML